MTEFTSTIEFNRFEIAEAYCCLEWDYNRDGWLRERPSNRRRMESVGCQLHRMKFTPRADLCFENLEADGKDIYMGRVLAWGLPIDEERKAWCESTYVPEYLQTMRPDVWGKKEEAA